jgi:hypothetical protein
MTSSPSSGPQNAQEIQFDSVTSRSRYVPGARFYRNVAIYRSRRHDASVRRCLRRIDVTGGAEERNTRSSDSFGVIAMVLITGKCSRHFHSCLHDLPISQQFSILQRLFNYPSEQHAATTNISKQLKYYYFSCSCLFFCTARRVFTRKRNRGNYLVRYTRLVLETVISDTQSD